MNDRIYSFLGLATKAGKVVSGDETCERAIKSGKVFLIIISEDASKNTSEKFSRLCNGNQLEIRSFGEKELLGRYIGKVIRSVVAITDEGFAKRLIEMLDGGKGLRFGGGLIGE